MAHAALIDAVQQQTAAAIAALWAEVRADAGRCRSEADRFIEQQADQHAARLRDATAASAREAAADAARRSRAIRAAAKAAVADRLRVLAGACLADLRDHAYAERFRVLAAELPNRRWARVTVHPDDAALAHAQFPGADVLADAAITGGMVAADDELSVDNSLERRLAAAWPELVPAVMTVVLHLISHSHAAA